MRISKNVYVTDVDMPLVRALAANGYKWSTICKFALWKFAVEKGIVEKPPEQVAEATDDGGDAK